MSDMAGHVLSIKAILNLYIIINSIKKSKDHKLKGSMKGIRELHLGFDDLLLYFIRNEENELILVDMGTHSHTLKK